MGYYNTSGIIVNEYNTIKKQKTNKLDKVIIHRISGEGAQYRGCITSLHSHADPLHEVVVGKKLLCSNFEATTKVLKEGPSLGP